MLGIEEHGVEKRGKDFCIGSRGIGWVQVESLPVVGQSLLFGTEVHFLYRARMMLPTFH